MKQRTTIETTNVLPVSRPHIRRRLLSTLRPEGALVPLDLDLVEIVAELDPGMIDFKKRRAGRLRGVSNQFGAEAS
ncbi:MAG: hypothetical protein ACR2NT_13565 [Acidimicrobiia bacterium]